MQKFNEIKWQLILLLSFVLLVMTQNEVMAACIRINNEELIEYNCEGGTLEDLEKIPDYVEKIHIRNIYVGRLDKSLLSRFGSSLLVLTCSHCLIKEVSDRAFEQLRNLQQLSLDNNHLKRVRANWFEPGLFFLTYLNLNYNQIENLDTALFDMVPSIVDLRLSGNRIECIDLQALSLLRDLKRIFINENSNFGCPNALRTYLTSRSIDYEPDPQWVKESRDRVLAGIFHTPADPSSTLTTKAVQSTPTTSRLYTIDSLQPFSSNQKFGFNTSIYYQPTAIPQRPSDYINTQKQSIHSLELPLNATTVTTSLPTEPTTTECPNSTAFNEPIIHFILVIVLTLLKFSILF